MTLSCHTLETSFLSDLPDSFTFLRSLWKLILWPASSVSSIALKYIWFQPITTLIGLMGAGTGGFQPRGAITCTSPCVTAVQSCILQIIKAVVESGCFQCASLITITTETIINTFSKSFKLISSWWMNLYYLADIMNDDHMEKDFQSTLVEPEASGPELRVSSSSRTIPVAFFT